MRYRDNWEDHDGLRAEVCAHGARAADLPVVEQAINEYAPKLSEDEPVAPPREETTGWRGLR
jgi:hypothetical protein